ncbi:vanadium-dependent haloperoxidase [Allomuricauda sp. M10]|uniref:vanadium-dependent haloperoxidase n=1 Tax=Allomuricauda sp. M10 TaxID=2683292 RepID=UPI001D188923|nr:vanadium-dependent haloperoxidase [Muricauda sp. M10]
MKVKVSLIAFVLLVLTSCQKKEEPIVITAEEFHQSVDKVIEVMIHDIFSPPVASRIFAYPNIAAYEIIAKKDGPYKSLAGQVTGLTSIPDPKNKENVNYDLAALVAHIDLSKRLIFSEEKIESYRDSLYNVWMNQNEAEFNASKEYGLEVADFIAGWMSKDNYKETRTMPKFTVDSDDPTRWQPTPPAYMNGIEPHWSKIRPFAIDSSAQFKPIPPPAFSMDKDSQFYKEVMEVYEVKKSMVGKGDKSDEIAIAQFWDCNPYVSVTRGHLMFATKKITPGAHWIGIAKIACRKTESDFSKTVYAYTKTSIAIADGFISCWDEKYRSNLIRPETVINEYIDDSWEPVLQTPPFPEYTSGHSVVSGAASTALTSVFGDGFAFDDDTEVPYGLPIRSFTSFNQAADEAAISRMYGGIHYRAAIEVGIQQGRNLGKFIVDKLDMTKS